MVSSEGVCERMLLLTSSWVMICGVLKDFEAVPSGPGSSVLAGLLALVSSAALTWPTSQGFWQSSEMRVPYLCEILSFSMTATLNSKPLILNTNAQLLKFRRLTYRVNHNSPRSPLSHALNPPNVSGFRI